MLSLPESPKAAFDRSIFARLKRFGPSDKGVAAVEFALVLPVMVMMYLGMTELTIGINVDRKLTLLSRTLADLSSRVTKMDTGKMSGVFAAATAVMQPYAATNVSMTVTSVVVTPGPSGTPVGTVDWSCKQGPNPVTHAKGSGYTVPKGFEAAQSFVLIETSLNYVPMFGGSFMGAKGGLMLGQNTPWPVRDGSQVAWQGSPCP